MASRSVNKVILIGNLTRDPEQRFTPQGTAVTSFSIATNREVGGRDGSERREVADFHNVVAWNKLAELCGQLLKRGTKTYVEGRLQTRDWMDKDGNKRYKTEVVIDEMIVLTRKSDAAGMGGGSYADSGEVYGRAGDDSESASSVPAPEASDDIDLDQVFEDLDAKEPKEPKEQEKEKKATK